MTPTFIISKLYANTVYMVLNSQIRIMGGQDIYMSSTDMEITTTMIRDITSHLIQGAQSMDGMQGQASVVAITKEVLSGEHGMSQMSVSHGDSCLSSKLIFPQGQITGQKLHCVTVKVLSSSHILYRNLH